MASESSTDPAPKILVHAQTVGGGWPVRCASVPVAGANASPILASTQHLTLETGHRRINGRAGHPSSRIMEIALQLSVLGFHISQTLLDAFDGAHETVPRSGPASNRPTASPGLVCMLPPQCSPMEFHHLERYWRTPAPILTVGAGRRLAQEAKKRTVFLLRYRDASCSATFEQPESQAQQVCAL